MCLFDKPKPAAASVAAPIIAAPDNLEANRQGDIEAALRRRRAGAAADIITSPRGIPAVPKMGQTQ